LLKEESNETTKENCQGVPVCGNGPNDLVDSSVVATATLAQFLYTAKILKHRKKKKEIRLIIRDHEIVFDEIRIE